MSDVVIDVRGLGKLYRLGASAQPSGTLREHLGALASAPAGWFKSKPKTSKAQSEKEFWAIRDVSFQVRQGDVVGIIGRNGAGKSTLLKILSRITEPTEGEAIIRGRVGSLLEVGTGFHPELTGRENVFLNGAILGMRRAEVAKKLDEIVAFAEIEKFLDTPVKRYSSGMYTRLAFAVAAHLEPEILIIDEVLAVGDVQFQQKCLGKMGAVAREGRTVLFVSHNMQAVSTLCSTGVYLRDGRMVADGPVHEVIAEYSRLNGETPELSWTGFDGDAELALLETAVVVPPDEPVLRTDRPIRVRARIRVGKVIFGLICAVELSNQAHARLVYSNHDDRSPPPPEPFPTGVYTFEFTIPPNSLAAGNYVLDFDVGIHQVRRVTRGEGRLILAVENVAGLGRRFYAHSAGVVRPDWPWEIVRTEALEPLPEPATADANP
jgi:lipopolysaccharide transport system ATP-binding protein